MTDQPASDLLDDLARLDYPLDRLAAIARVDVAAYEARYVAERRRALLEARTLVPRPTWRELGEVLGVSAQRAEAMSKQETTNERNQP